MIKPRFKLNQRVYYSTKDCYGKIVKVLNIGDPEDIFLQGYRYIVELEGQFYDQSIADDYLELKKPQNEGEFLNDIKGAKSQNPPGSTGLKIKRVTPRVAN